jgi:peptidylprolyl isomerase domain and WD repeat-containing protein 1
MAPDVTSPSKRPHDSDSDSDDDFGPSLPTSSAPAKKRRKLPYEKLYIAALPKATRYSRSLMHRDPLTSVDLTPVTDFLITTSADGVVKFWKKVSGGVEFVKEFRAHEGLVRGTSVSVDGRSFASCGVDGTVKIWDVVTFDLVGVIALGEGEVPGCVAWVHGRGASMPLLAVGFEGSSEIRVFDGRGGNDKPVQVVGKLHKRPVTTMAYNDRWDCVVSADEGGMVEYWSPGSGYEKPDGVWDMKSSTNLFDFKKVRLSIETMCVNSNFSSQNQHLLQSLYHQVVNNSPHTHFQIAKYECLTSKLENYTELMMNLLQQRRKCNKPVQPSTT